MKKRPVQQLLVALLTVVTISSCKKDPAIIIVPPSDGQTQTLNGGAGGASAENTVFVDLSTDKMTSVLRKAWDLSVYCGSEFRVLLNNSTSAGALVTSKTDLTQVTGADTVGLTLSVNQANPQPSDFAYFDDIAGSISQTVIPAVSATEADNKVVILNRGTGGGIAARPWIKLRVLRNGSTGYTIQFAGINETTFKTITVTKDALYHFKSVSFDNNGATVDVQPEKTAWDIQWGYSLFKTNFGADVPYNFSDLVSLNHLAGVQVAEVLTSTVSYAAYAEANIATTTFSTNRWAIGSNWRATTGTVGVKTDRFYVIKDAAGNVYKLKFNSFTSNDGGERGKPVIEYKLVKKA